MYEDKENGYGIVEEPTEVQAAIIAKLDMWKNRQKKPCKAFTEVNGKQKSKWTVCPFGGLGEITDHGSSVKYTADNAYWKENTYCMTAEESNADCADGQKVELDFVCQKGNRDVIKSAKRSKDGCTVNMEVRTNVVC